MPLVFAAITPHPPLLLPTIGMSESKKISRTTEAMDELEEDLYASMPDVILMISPHGSLFSNVFTINFCTEYVTDLKKFGDLSTQIKFRGDHEMAHRLRDTTKRNKFPASMVSEPNLDHGSSIPLYFLTRHLPDMKIIQLGFCDLDYKSHINFGLLIQEQIQLTNRRVAVIASADLSHALTDDSPAGFNKSGRLFDETLREMLNNNNIAKIVQLDKKLVSEASECGLRSIVILLGVLSQTHYTYKELSYEAPFGVGYMTAQFIL